MLINQKLNNQARGSILAREQTQPTPKETNKIVCWITLFLLCSKPYYQYNEFVK